jgi:CBS domain-containing protein
MASLARLLRNDAVVDELVACPGPDDVLAVRKLGELPIQPTLAVRDVMLTRVETLPPETPVRDAVNLMIRRRMRAVPIVGEKGEVLGLVSDRDIMRALVSVPRAGDEPGIGDAVRPSDLVVRDIMSRSVLCISEDLALDEAATIMVNKDINVLPVVAEGNITGLITRGEIIRKLFGP